MHHDELSLFSALVGEPVVAVERCAMGFENRTDKVTLASGESRIVQQITNAGMAAHKIRLARALPKRLGEVRLYSPRVLHADERATPPFLVRECVEGESGASFLATSEQAIRLATIMGELLPMLALVQTKELGLNTAWANPARVVTQAQRQLERRCETLSKQHGALLEATIDAYETLFADRSAVFAHGDFCPVNIIVPTTEHKLPIINCRSSVVIIDLEFARVADPLFDLAWWSWVVRYHHEAQWHAMFPHFLLAAGIANDETTHARIRAIQHLRLLEALDYNATLSLERGAAWAERLATTLDWAD